MGCLPNQVREVVPTDRGARCSVHIDALLVQSMRQHAREIIQAKNP
jgi:hypothetical protein